MLSGMGGRTASCEGSEDGPFGALEFSLCHSFSSDDLLEALEVPESKSKLLQATLCVGIPGKELGT